MQTANFKFQGKFSSTLWGTVTKKDDGKISVSLRDGKYTSAAHRYQAKAFATKCAEEGFVHPDLFGVKSSNTSKGLVAILTEKTQDLKATFIEQTKAWAKKKFLAMSEVISLGYEDQLIRYSVDYVMNIRTRAISVVSDKYNRKRYTKMNSAVDSFTLTVAKGYDAYEVKEVKNAEEHYADSIAKLAYRLNQKGITDDSKFEITTGRVAMNFECTIKHEHGITKAWTIIAEGEINRPHYRYLVK